MQIWSKVKKMVIHNQVWVDIHKTSAFGFFTLLLHWYQPKLLGQSIVGIPIWAFFFVQTLSGMKDEKDDFVLVPQYQKIVDHNIIILLKVSFLIKASVNYIIKICPVETVDTSAINTCRAAWGRHSIVPNHFLSWKMYFFIKRLRNSGFLCISKCNE